MSHLTCPFGALDRNEGLRFHSRRGAGTRGEYAKSWGSSCCEPHGVILIVCLEISICRLNEPQSVLLRTATRTSRKGCTVHLFHRICCFLIMRFDKISLTALSTKAVEIGRPSWRRRP